MQAQRIRRKLNEDERIQRAILALVLAVHPHYRTLAEVSREIGSKEAVERAVRRLSDYGLVRLHGHTLLLTDAAFYCHRLDAW
jgi:predicted transcriptional regulator with HTH domain